MHGDVIAPAQATVAVGRAGRGVPVDRAPAQMTPPKGRGCGHVSLECPLELVGAIQDGMWALSVEAQIVPDAARRAVRTLPEGSLAATVQVAAVRHERTDEGRHTVDAMFRNIGDT